MEHVRKNFGCIFVVCVSLHVLTFNIQLKTNESLYNRLNSAVLSRRIESTQETAEKNAFKYTKAWLGELALGNNEYNVKYVHVREPSAKFSYATSRSHGTQHTSAVNYLDNSGNLRFNNKYPHNTHDKNEKSSDNYQNTRKGKTNFAERLQYFLTHPTAKCKRLVRVGGRSCVGAYDGSKFVCMDDDVVPRSLNCLVYSFGVGNDFTFDRHMQDYGCEVHSFDHDDDHEIYDYRQGPMLFFHKIRIGVKSGYYRNCKKTQRGYECAPTIRYKNINDIRKMLKHESSGLDYFKMDIEGAEWKVLRDIIENSNVLTNTKQVALEIHLDDICNNITMAEKRSVLENSWGVFAHLRQLGFELAAYEENGMNPTYKEIDGVKLNVYAEVLFLKKT